MKRWLLIWIPLAFLLAMPCRWGEAVLDGRPDKHPRYTPGRIIVKLTPPAYEKIAPAMRGQDSIDPQELPIEPLRQVSQRFQVFSWKRLFPPVSGEDPTGLRRIYLLTCDPQVDVPAAAGAFSALAEWVEYAEPDFLVEVQPSLQ